MAKILDLLAIDTYRGDEAAWLAGWVQSFLFFISLSTIIFSFMVLPSLQEKEQFGVVIAIIIVFLITVNGGGWWLLRRGNLRQANLWIVTLLFLFIVYVDFALFGLQTLVPVAYFLLVVFVALLLGERSLGVVSILILAIILFQIILEQRGLLQPIIPITSTSQKIVIFILFFAHYILMLALMLRRQKKQVDEVSRNQERYQTLFEHAPIAIWEQDSTEVVAYLERLRGQGVTDLRAYLASHPQAVAECIQRTRVVDVNETAVQMYHADNKHQLMENLGQFLPENEYEFVLDSLTALANRDASFTREMTNRSPNGDQFDVLFRWVVSPHNYPDEIKIFSSIVDISQQKAAERAQRKYAERLQILHQLDLSVLAMQTPGSVAQTALEYLQRLVPCDQAGVAFFDLSRNLSKLIASAGPDSFFGDRATIDNQKMVESLRAGNHFLFSDLETVAANSDDLQRMVNMGANSLLIIPLIVQKGLIGNLILAARAVDAFSAEHVKIAQEISAPLAIGLQNTKLLEAEQQAWQRTETLRKSSMVLASSLEKQEVLELILAQLARLIAADRMAIILLGSQGISIAAHRGYDSGDLKNFESHGQIWKNLYEVVQQKETVYIPDTKMDVNWNPMPETAVTRSWLGIPLLAHGNILGLISISHKKPDFCTEEDINWISVFAGQAALALGNAVLYEDVQSYANDMEERVAERTRELSTLYDVTAITAEYQDLEAILSQALRQTLNALKCSAGAIHVWNAKERSLDRIIKEGIEDDYLCLIENRPEADNLLHFVMASTQPLLASPTTRPALPGARGFQTYMGAPMRAQGKMHGVLSVYADDPQYFSVEDVALLDSIADQVGIAIENGRLQQQAYLLAVVEERNRLARDLHDSVTQSLYSLTLFAEAAREQAGAGNLEKVQKHAETITTTVQQTLKEMRLMVYELWRSGRGHMGLGDALRTRLDMVEKRSGVNCELQINEVGSLPGEVQDVYFMIAQEALNNALKHAEATAVFVLLHRENNILIMEIRDNGCGFEIGEANKMGGLGLTTMRERIEEIGGSIDIKSESDRGTIIKVQYAL